MVGFERILVHVVVRMVLSVVVAGVLVGLEAGWDVIVVPTLFLTYFILQLFLIRAKKPSPHFPTISTLFSYSSLLLSLPSDPFSPSYIGWLLISLFCTLIFSTILKNLRKFLNFAKMRLIKKGEIVSGRRVC